MGSRARSVVFIFRWDFLDSIHMKNRNTSPFFAALTASAGIAFVMALAVSTIAVATPPKGGKVENSDMPVEGQPKKVASGVMDIRGGVSEVVWLDALSRVHVTAEQRESITPLVRNYLAKSKAWREKESVELTGLAREITRIRTDGGVVPPELMARIRSLRMQLPRLRVVQEAIGARLTMVQQESLLENVQELKIADQLRANADRARRAVPIKQAPESGDALQDSPQKPAGESTVDGPKKGDPKKTPENVEVKQELPWSFVK